MSLRPAASYRQAVAWQLDAMPGLDCTVVQTTPADEQGTPSSAGGRRRWHVPARGGELATPVVVVDVPDVDAALEQVEAWGGSTVLPREPWATRASGARFRDCEGLMGPWQGAG